MHDFKISPQLVTFSRCLVDGWRDDWLKILDDVVRVDLGEGTDILSWKFGPKGRFSVQSVYDALLDSECGTYHKKIWKSKYQLRSKSFFG